uniref:Formamidopyrimidine-DNA glycosylase catalytic domain-containing protein n=1 Tax=Daphnia galeata TaxID=27404 RepID=A0A8J2RYG8_9CRUS|nr:unnamed protein product [Daphnia galeata]
MPEGPELHISSKFVNESLKELIFSGKILKSEVSKNPNVEWKVPLFTIQAESRGKEMKLWLQEFSPNKINSQLKKISILFRFGMSGCFKLSTADDIPKHSHLRFFTIKDGQKPIQVLNFVDFRRFGKWEVNADWGLDRGPCPIMDYENFRKNIVDNLGGPAFKQKAVCEVLLNQKFFNGIGNYLRAEILFRSKIAPFDEAYTVLCNWKDAACYPNKRENVEKSDIRDPLYLCHAVCIEVLKLSGGYDVEKGLKDNTAFKNWLQCYQNPSMKNLKDRHQRTIWFDGEPGILAPRDNPRRPKTKKQRISVYSPEPNLEPDNANIPKVRKMNLTETKLTVDADAVTVRRSPRFSGAVINSI